MSEYIYNADCLKFINSQEFKKLTKGKQVVIVTDPPFNVNYHYGEYKDNKDKDEYLKWLTDIFNDYSLVLIHYAESIIEISHAINKIPSKVVSWVYNSNTAKQHREIAFFDIKPDFNLVRQPYKNPNDKRIQERIKNGKGGAKLYDWWNVNQIKNVSKEKTKHPCQMPLKVMENIIGILPNKQDIIVVDTFMGSGTTALACKKYGVDFIGTEIDKEYFEIAKQRLEDYGKGQQTLF